MVQNGIRQFPEYFRHVDIPGTGVSVDSEAVPVDGQCRFGLGVPAVGGGGGELMLWVELVH
jgi:hypothetical protein